MFLITFARGGLRSGLMDRMVYWSPGPVGLSGGRWASAVHWSRAIGLSWLTEVGRGLQACLVLMLIVFFAA